MAVYCAKVTGHFDSGGKARVQCLGELSGRTGIMTVKSYSGSGKGRKLPTPGSVIFFKRITASGFLNNVAKMRGTELISEYRSLGTVAGKFNEGYLIRNSNDNSVAYCHWECIAHGTQTLEIGEMVKYFITKADGYLNLAERVEPIHR